MLLSSESIQKLLSYVKTNEVVYQVCGELVEISNDANPENRESLLKDFSHASGIDVFEKGASFIHEPFEELDNWSTKDDMLFLLETIGTLICIPRKLVVENNII